MNYKIGLALRLHTFRLCLLIYAGKVELYIYVRTKIVFIVKIVKKCHEGFPKHCLG